MLSCTQDSNQRDPAFVAAAWDALKVACLGVEAWPVVSGDHSSSSSSADKEGAGNAVCLS